MRIPFPLRTIGGSAIPDTNDNPVFIPPTLQPTTEFPGQIKQLVTSGSGPVADSFVTIFTALVQNTGAFGGNIILFKAGLWRVNIFASMISDTTIAQVWSNRALVSLFNANTSKELMALYQVANVPQQVQQSYVFSFPDDTWLIGATGGNNAAGQNYQLDVSIYGERLA